MLSNPQIYFGVSKWSIKANRRFCISGTSKPSKDFVKLEVKNLRKVGINTAILLMMSTFSVEF